MHVHMNQSQRLADLVREQQRLNMELDSLTKRFRDTYNRLNKLGQKRHLPRTSSCRGKLLIPKSTIQELAYTFWVQEGYPEGRALEHWFRAENELMHKK